MALKYAKMRWRPGRTPLGELTTLPRPPSRLERGTPPPQTPSLRRASILAPAALVFQPEPYHFLKRSGADVVT